MAAASESLAQTFAYSKVVHRRQSAYDVPTGTIKGLPLADRGTNDPSLAGGPASAAHLGPKRVSC